MSSDETTTRFWFDRARKHFYAIPEDAELPEGELTLHSLRGQVWRVNSEDVAAWEVSREEATASMGEHINAAWGEMRGAWSRLLDMGQKTADAAGMALDGESRPELPEDLASLLGMEPGELFTEPGLIRSKLRRALFGEDDASAPDVVDAEPEAAPEPEVTHEVAPEPALDDDEAEAPAGARVEDLAKKAEQTMRGVLNSPEFGAAVAGFGAALRRAGQKLQQAAESLEE